MGSVYRALRDDGTFSQQVAIKIVKSGWSGPEVVERFRRERQILALVNHPHVAQIFDGGSTPDGRPYPADERANDLVHWQTIVGTADAVGAGQALRRARARFVSPGVITLGDSAKSAVVRDPDGHAVLVHGRPN